MDNQSVDEPNNKLLEANGLKHDFSIDLSSITIPSLENEQKKDEFKSSLEKLKMIRSFLTKAEDVIKQNHVPSVLITEFREVRKEFFEKVSELNSLNSHNRSKNITSFTQAIENVHSYYLNFFEISSSNKKLPLCNTIINLDNISNSNIQAKAAKLLDDLKIEADKIAAIRKEWELKSSETVVSKYAEIFQSQEKNHIDSAQKWFIISITLTIIFLALLFLSSKYNLFNTTERLERVINGEQDIRLIYNYPNLITKFLIISLCIYLISFSVKQYSINKNLEASNNHRKNALNSYKLFTETIGENDSNSRNALMLQVAKAIYEPTATGYLSSKHSENTGNGIIEMTKFVTEPKA